MTDSRTEKRLKVARRPQGAPLCKVAGNARRANLRRPAQAAVVFDLLASAACIPRPEGSILIISAEIAFARSVRYWFERIRSDARAAPAPQTDGQRTVRSTESSMARQA